MASVNVSACSLLYSARNNNFPSTRKIVESVPSPSSSWIVGPPLSDSHSAIFVFSLSRGQRILITAFLFTAESKAPRFGLIQQIAGKLKLPPCGRDRPQEIHVLFQALFLQVFALQVLPCSTVFQKCTVAALLFVLRCCI